jgi:FixJ family two-component response regulator
VALSAETGRGVTQESITIFIIDDDESVRTALRRLLGSAGYRSLSFATAEDFLDSTVGQGSGCLVLDIHLPGMTGLELQEKLDAGDANYAVIFITAHDNPQWQERARKAGAVAYLEKPFAEAALLDAIQLARAKMDNHI